MSSGMSYVDVEDHFQDLLMDSIPVLVSYVDKTRVYRYVNKTYEKWFNTSRENIIGRSVEEVIGENAYTAVKGKIDSVLNGEHLQFETELSYRTGKRYVHVDYMPHMFNGTIAGYIAMIIDISERKDAEQKLIRKSQELQDYFDNATVGLHWVDENGIIIWANKAELQMLGYEPHEYIGHHIGKFHVDQNVIGDILKRLSDRESLNQYESIMRCKDGSLKHVMINSNVLFDDDQFVHTRCFTLDVTAKKQAESFLSKANQELERKVLERTGELTRKNLELEQFAAVASHDLQEPLRKISTFSDILKGTQCYKNDKETAKYVDKISKASGRMASVIRDLLSLTQLDIKEEYEEVNLNDIFEDVRNDLELLIAQKKATLRVNRLPKVEGFPLQLYQLFFNLIGNALKFARTDIDPIVHISSSMVSQDEKRNHQLHPEKEFVCISVRDNGIGFEQKYADHIFAAFKRLHPSSYSGTGIGLALCKKVVENHGGIIFCESEPNKGSTFITILPTKQSDLSSTES